MARNGGKGRERRDGGEEGRLREGERRSTVRVSFAQCCGVSGRRRRRRRRE